MNGPTRLSPIFIILIVIVVGVFAYAMINLGQLPTPEEEREAFVRQTNDVMIAEEAQATGLTQAEVKLRWKKRDEKQRLFSQLRNAINIKDHILVSDLLGKLTKNDFSETGALIFRDALVADNEISFHLLLKKSIPCNNQSVTGRNAFIAAISSANPAYIKMLLDNNCKYQIDSKYKSLEREIVDSAHPEKIFQLSKIYIKESYRDQAFLTAISKGMTQPALTMLDLGANPNAVFSKNSRSALAISLFANRPQIAMRLIQKDADIHFKNKNDQYMLTIAFLKGHLDVAREMLKRDAGYLQQKNIEHSSFFYVFMFIKNVDLRREAVALLLQYGVDPLTFKNGGHSFLKSAVKFGDPLLVKQLLEAGIDLNKPDKISELLDFAKTRNVSKIDEIVSLLEEAKKSNDASG